MFAFASLTSSLDDIVFEGRNQAYGAYDLRRSYRRHLASAGAIALLGCFLLLSLWAAWRALDPTPVVISAPTKGIIELIEVKPDPSVIYQAKQAAEPAPRPVAQARSAVAAPRAAAMPTQVAKDEDPLAKQPLENTLVDGDPRAKPDANSNTEGGDAASTSTGNELTGPAESDPTPVAEPVIFAEKMPEFAGGPEALMRYLRKHLRYPSRALAAGISGRVYLSFVVQTDGTISEVATLKGLGYGLDEEAMRVVRNMPAWTPGQQNQHAVPVRFNLPITFQVE